MNSIAIVNWEDEQAMQRIAYSLGKFGYLKSEEYEESGVKTTVWKKEPKDSTTERTVGADPLAALKMIPAETIAHRLMGRLRVMMPPDTSQADLLWAAMNLAFDLQGKPG